MPGNIEKCRKLVATLERKEYFSAALEVYNGKYQEIINDLVASSGLDSETAAREAYRLMLSHICEILRGSEQKIRDVIYSRLERGELHDTTQATKSVAGNLFQQLFAYSLAKNIIVGNISKNVVVSLSPKILDEYAIIKVGDDLQKPDSDVLVYSEDDTATPIINFSCKTSCRERAGQTYKWKLLSDLATCSCIHKNGNNDCPITKYNLQYDFRRKIYMCFVTADFYNELRNPQVEAMFNFFDNAYVAKISSDSNKVKPLLDVVEDINNSIN